MKKRIIFICVSMIISNFFGQIILKDVFAFNQDFVVLVDDASSYDLNLLENIDKRYGDIQVTLIEDEDFNSSNIGLNTYLCVENSLLVNPAINAFVKDYVKNNYVSFIGQTTINVLSKLYKKDLTEYQTLYAYIDSDHDQELLESKLINMPDDEISVLKYSENMELKDNMSKSLITGKTKPLGFLVPCLNDYIEMNTDNTQTYSKIKSGTSNNLYLTDSVTGLTKSNYVKWTYSISKDINESDSSKDYYLFQSTSYFSSLGHYMITSHEIGSSSGYSLASYPGSKSATVSWSVDYGGLSFTYNGISVKISASSPSSQKNQWIFQRGNATGTSNFDSGDKFFTLSEFAVPQGTSPTFKQYIYALDNAVGKFTNTYTVKIN